MKKECLFFVYGTLKKGFHNNYLLSNAEFLGNFTTKPEYTLFDGNFPVVERDGETAIQGELYLSKDKEDIDSVFRLEGCISQKQHDKNNWYDYDLLETPHGKAVIFVMDEGKSNRNKILNSGKWN